jgi:membrane-associated phospholipid phosphatase
MGLRLLLLIVIAGPGMIRFSAAQDIPSETAAPETPVPAETAETAATTAPQPAVSVKGFDGTGWKRLIPNLAADQKTVWLFPIDVAKGRHVKPTLAVTGTTVGLVALDPWTGRYFQRTKTTTYSGFNKVFSSKNTAIANFAIPIALYGIGLARKDVYAQRTFILAGQAVLTSEILTTVMKDVTRRANPALIPPGGDFSDTWFKKGGGNWVRGIGAFPSGHAISAFSVATVYAERYPTPRWKPILAYGLAAVAGFSRVSLETHYVSDVFLGSALGYFIGRHVVRRDSQR